MPTKAYAKINVLVFKMAHDSFFVVCAGAHQSSALASVFNAQAQPHTENVRRKNKSTPQEKQSVFFFMPLKNYREFPYARRDSAGGRGVWTEEAGRFILGGGGANAAKGQDDMTHGPDE